uniref:NADH-ubiquinone oxidoreductase chain 3 n=1 Tax=Pupa strigosa TaxID=96460 RepID=Q9T9F9_9GAST|nr:NADH dehydrogenase subunit 3 [Pupa strigosa]BAA89024.1 ND3 [Pupa strigosa]
MMSIHMSISIVLPIALVLVFGLVSFLSSTSEEKSSVFECGFDPLSKMRAPFSTRFFLLVILFLVFDVEVALLFPILSTLGSSSTYSIFLALWLFLLVLLAGTLHEWNEGALDWVSA